MVRAMGVGVRIATHRVAEQRAIGTVGVQVNDQIDGALKGVRMILSSAVSASIAKSLAMFSATASE
jgi:hypothetical protein